MEMRNARGCLRSLFNFCSYHQHYHCYKMLASRHTAERSVTVDWPQWVHLSETFYHIQVPLGVALAIFFALNFFRMVIILNIRYFNAIIISYLSVNKVSVTLVSDGRVRSMRCVYETTLT